MSINDQGINLALDRLFRTPITEHLAGLEDPNQMARRQTPMPAPTGTMPVVLPGQTVPEWEQIETPVPTVTPDAVRQAEWEAMNEPPTPMIPEGMQVPPPKIEEVPPPEMLQTAAKGLVALTSPWWTTGIGIWSGMEAARKSEGVKTPEGGEEANQEYEEFAAKGGVPEDYMPGGEKFTEYASLPALERFAYELPAFIAALVLFSTTGGATGIRAAITGKGKLATVARGALWPLEKVEQLSSKILTKLLGKPIGWIKGKIGEKQIIQEFHNSPLYQEYARAQASGLPVPREKALLDIYRLMGKGDVGSASGQLEEVWKAFPQIRPGTKGASLALYDPSLFTAAESHIVDTMPIVSIVTDAASGADRSTTTALSKIIDSLMAGNITAESVTPALINSYASGQLSVPSSLVSQLMKMGFPAESVGLMSPEEAWGSLFEQPMAGGLPAKPGENVPKIVSEQERAGMAAEVAKAKGEVPSVVPHELSEQERTAMATDVVNTKLIDAVNQARPAREITEKLRSEELSKRVGKAEVMLETFKGDEAFKAAKGELAGVMPKAAMEGVGTHFTVDEVNILKEEIKAANLDFFDKIHTEEALVKLFTGDLPSERELLLLEDVFGPELTKAIIAKGKTGGKILDIVVDVLGIPKSLMAMADVSHLLRQGWLFTVGAPEVTYKAWPKAIQTFFSETQVEKLMDEIKNSPYHKLHVASGLNKYILPVTKKASATALPTRREEAYPSHLIQRIPGKVPIFGQVSWVMRASERSFTSGLNKIMVDMFDYYASRWDGEDVSVDTYKALADFCAIGVGRASIGSLARAGTLLNTVTFSPKLQYSRIQLLSGAPLRYTPKVRKIYIHRIIRAIGTTLALIGLAKLIWKDKVKVSTDSNSTDFMKVQVGDTRIDPWAGFQQYMVLISRLITGERTSQKGEAIDTNAWEALSRFAESKGSPAVNAAKGFMTGKTYVGEEFMEVERILDYLTPFVSQDILDAMHEDGWLGASLGALGIPGIGISSYAHPTFANWTLWIEDKIGGQYIEDNYRDLQGMFKNDKEQWFEYMTMPKGKIRDNYREDNPELEAALYFWGETGSISNPETWKIIDAKLDKLGLPSNILPVKTPTEEYEFKDKTPTEMLNDLTNVFPSYISDYVLENQGEWEQKDLPTLVPLWQERKEKDSSLILQYDRARTDISRLNQAWRADHPEIDVALNLWGRVSTVQSSEARDMLRKVADEMGIPYDIFKALSRTSGMTKG